MVKVPCINLKQKTKNNNNKNQFVIFSLNPKKRKKNE